MRTSSKFLAPAGILTLAAVAWGVAAAPWQPPPGYEPLPPELQGDIPPGTTPQSEDDLRRTRDALYGRTLTVAQHDEILSWRTHDLEWWTDDVRRAGAKARLAALDDLFDTLADQGQFEDVLGSADDFYGLQVELEWESSGTDDRVGSPPPVLRQAVVTFDGRVRPDLFDFYEMVYDFASSVVGSGVGEGEFLEVIEPSAETTDGLQAYQATVDYIEALKQEVGALTSVRMGDALHLHVDLGAAYTAADGEAFQEGLRAEIDALTELRTREYLLLLRDDYKKRLSAHVVNRVRTSTSRTLGFYSRSLKESQAADFENVLSILRGGKQ